MITVSEFYRMLILFLLFTVVGLSWLLYENHQTSLERQLKEARSLMKECVENYDIAPNGAVIETKFADFINRTE